MKAVVRRILASLVIALGLMVATSQAVDITITFANGTPVEVRAVQWALAKANAARAAQTPPLPPYANMRAFFEANLRDQLASWVAAEAADHIANTADIQRRWNLATDAQRAAALAQLPALP